MVNEKDLEKLALLEAIQAMACHNIDSEALKNCPYHQATEKAKDTIQSAVSAGIATELGISPRKDLNCRR